MDIELWESLPPTNNPEEAMHWKLYSACGRDHSFLEGLASLYKVALYYERQYQNAQSMLSSNQSLSFTDYLKVGVPLRYGEAERWKRIAATTGRTKTSRAAVKSGDKKRKRNDGRPPDTSKELLSTKKQKNSGTSTANKNTLLFGPVSYPWKANSCWLDTSLELLYATLLPHFDEFGSLCQSLVHSSGLHTFYTTLQSRRLLEIENKASSLDLSMQRDVLKQVLKDKGLANKGDTFEPLAVSHSRKY